MKMRAVLLCLAFLLVVAGLNAQDKAFGVGTTKKTDDPILVGAGDVASCDDLSGAYATAKLIEIDGRRLVFQVEAYDEQRQIGEGRHERFIVNLERFLKQ